MKRLIYSQLLQWKQQKERFPLILKGARQVGKTTLLKEFGSREFKNVFVFDFEKDLKELSDLFERNLEPKRILNGFSLFANKDIQPQSDLLIFDEIQNCPKALASLKYFAEEQPQLAICCAGSLLGLTLSDESFPVGKVNFLSMYPMNFEEFLLATAPLSLYEVWKSSIKQEVPLGVHNQLWDCLKDYYVTGGMPRVVAIYHDYQLNKVEAFNQVRRVQQEIVLSYQSDFNKHAGKVNAMHLASVFNNIPQQLSKNHDDSVKRYRFKDVIPAKKGYGSFEGPIDWLVKAGLALRVYVCNRAEFPFKAFVKENIFKLYLMDIGLLGSMLELSPQILIQQDYGIAKGYFAENFVAQELVASSHHQLYAWQERNSEIEFLLNLKDKIVPVEVKSGHRTQAQSLRQYMIKYSPHKAIKISQNRLAKKDKLMDVPLYLAGQLLRTIGS